jgi:hypothetical protein
MLSNGLYVLPVYVCVYTYIYNNNLFLSTRLLCETQEKVSPVRNVASVETLGTPPSVPDSGNNPVSPSHQLSQSTPLSHLPHSVSPATDLNNLINAPHIRQQQIPTGKQPLSLTGSRQAEHPDPLSPVSIIKIMTVNAEVSPRRVETLRNLFSPFSCCKNDPESQCELSPLCLQWIKSAGF